jgi:hypothetical protein
VVLVLGICIGRLTATFPYHTAQSTSHTPPPPLKEVVRDVNLANLPKGPPTPAIEEHAIAAPITILNPGAGDRAPAAKAEKRRRAAKTHRDRRASPPPPFPYAYRSGYGSLREQFFAPRSGSD